MTSILNYSVETIANKQALLDTARAKLKQEFVGIDTVIDSIINSITTWFLFPEIQERPLVINLWGMTGVGKTDLIKKLSGLLNYDKKLFRFDMGSDNTGCRNMKDILKVIFNNNNGKAYMLMMDEFQYAKTKNEMDQEVDNPYSRVLWDLLDEGKLQSYRDAETDLEDIAKLKVQLASCIKEGVIVENGFVIKNEEALLDILQSTDECEFGCNEPERYYKVEENGKTRYCILPKYQIKTLFKFYPNKSTTIFEFRKMLETLDGLQTLELLEKIYEYGNSHLHIDCSKTVIFILGNLDDAYQMSSNINPDINADDFHEASKEININHIKKALKKRFKNEQIARLGNNHIIYPAFSQQTFQQLIQLELKKTAAIYLEKFEIHLAFTERFCTIIYQEGVYPSQGTRPLFSTIYQMVNTKIPLLLSENILKNLCADTILFDYDATELKCLFFQENNRLHELRIPVQLNLEKLRAPEKDDRQAITAVHESGHAIISIAASRVLPDYICSTSADTSTVGFVVIKNKWNYLSKEAAIKKIAEYLGGLLAEKLIFGEDKITRGAGQDIDMATELATKMIRDYGMGKSMAKVDVYGFGSRYSYLDKNDDCNLEVKTLLLEGAILAEKILLQEKPLLLQLANILSDERIIKKEAIADLAKKYGSHYLQAAAFIEDGKHLFYRNHLKNQLQNINASTVNNVPIDSSMTSLNRST